MTDLGKIAKALADLWGCPCDFSPLDEKMQEYCCDNYMDESGEYCQMHDTECWRRWLEKVIGETEK